jgi:hypothetical protein
MANHQKDSGIALLQRNPARDAFLEKMRSKLASTPPPSVENEARKRSVRKKSAASWTLRAGILLAVIAANYFLLGNRNTIVAKLGLESVPALPLPQTTLSADDQALYWTYAMYDIGKFRERFGVAGYYAINQTSARRNLENLLPEVSPAVLGEISAYTSVAFKTVKMGGRP